MSEDDRKKDEACCPSSPPNMELLSLEPSPYSKRVVWALRLVGLDYVSTQYTSIAGEPALRWRLGRWNPWTTTATVPIGFVSTNGTKKEELVLDNGFDIVEWAQQEQQERRSSKNTSPTAAPLSLIPKDRRKEVVEYCTLADEIQNFDRSMFLKALAHHPPSVLRAVAGDGPPNAVLYGIAFVVGTFMRNKYRSTLGTNAPEVQTKLTNLTQHLSNKQQQQKKDGSLPLVYLVGDRLTLADIFMSVAICGGVKDRTKPQSKHEIVQQEAIAKQAGFAMKETYPLLYHWAVEISEKHA